jgi:hypothetical protein
MLKFLAISGVSLGCAREGRVREEDVVKSGGTEQGG